MAGVGSNTLSPTRTKAAKWLRQIIIGVAVAYPGVLIVVALLLRFVGESWWATDLGLYMPRALFALPLPFTLTALALYRATRLLATQLVAAFVVFFPLMGFVLPWPASAHEGEPTLRVLSYNVNSGYGGYDKIAAEVDAFSPDIVLFQEIFAGSEQIAELLGEKYPTVQTSTQFLIASRFPILSSSDPEKVPHLGRLRSPRFVQYVIDTPLGPIALYNVHPLSPRHGFYKLRGAGLRREILSGRLFGGENAALLQSDAALRGEQVEAVSRSADHENDPVVIAGDTNLPSLSMFLHRYLSRFHDGFREAGWGFGYTFPADKRPWMRIDRILASDELRFVGFEVGRSKLSDHYCVVADLQRRAH